MVRFIKQEAQEKANEIRVSAEEVRVRITDRSCCLFGVCPSLLSRSRASRKTDSQPSHPPHHTHHAVVQEFNLEKLQLLEQEKAKIRKDYERKESQVEVKKKM